MVLFLWVKQVLQEKKNSFVLVLCAKKLVTCAKAGSWIVFKWVLYPGRTGIWKCCFFVEGGKPENPVKNLQSKARTNNKLNPHMETGWNRTTATLVGDERSHCCTIPAPLVFVWSEGSYQDYLHAISISLVLFPFPRYWSRSGESISNRFGLGHKRRSAIRVALCSGRELEVCSGFNDWLHFHQGKAGLWANQTARSVHQSFR